MSKIIKVYVTGKCSETKSEDKSNSNRFFEQFLKMQNKLTLYINFYINDYDTVHELSQDIMLHAYNRYNTANKYTDTGKFSAWILSIARCKIMDKFRNTSKRNMKLYKHHNLICNNLGWAEATTYSYGSDKTFLEKSDLYDFVHVCMNNDFSNCNLKDTHRKVLSLKTKNALTFKAISEELNEPISTIISRYNVAMNNFKAYLDKIQILD